MSSDSATSRIREVRHLSVSIARSAGHAYAFLSEPAHLVRWATGLGALREEDRQWVVDTPEGLTRVRFCARNRLGVLDPWIEPPGGEPVYVPIRVVANGVGCELTLTLFRQPDMDDKRFAADAAWIMRDLDAAKSLLEAA